MNNAMAHSRKGGRRPRPEPTPVASPLGRWGAMFYSRGNPVMKLEQAGCACSSTFGPPNRPVSHLMEAACTSVRNLVPFDRVSEWHFRETIADRGIDLSLVTCASLFRYAALRNETIGKCF
jgi:hypothetical protein